MLCKLHFHRFAAGEITQTHCSHYMSCVLQAVHTPHHCFQGLTGVSHNAEMCFGWGNGRHNTQYINRGAGHSQVSGKLGTPPALPYSPLHTWAEAVPTHTSKAMLLPTHWGHSEKMQSGTSYGLLAQMSQRRTEVVATGHDAAHKSHEKQQCCSASIYKHNRGLLSVSFIQLLDHRLRAICPQMIITICEQL